MVITYASRKTLCDVSYTERSSGGHPEGVRGVDQNGMHEASKTVDRERAEEDAGGEVVLGGPVVLPSLPVLGREEHMHWERQRELDEQLEIKSCRRGQVLPVLLLVVLKHVKPAAQLEEVAQASSREVVRKG